MHFMKESNVIIEELIKETLNWCNLIYAATVVITEIITKPSKTRKNIIKKKTLGK